MAEVYTAPFTLTTSAPYVAGSGTISVSAAAPTAIQTGTFRVRLANSSNTVLKVTDAGNGTTWNVTAEFNDANASSGTTVYGCEFSPGALDQIRVDQVQTGALVSAVTSHAGNLYLPSDGISIARDSGTGLYHYGPIWPNVAVPSTGWSWDNQSTAVLTSAHGIESLSLGGNAPGLVFRYRSAPLAPYTFSALLARDFPLASGSYDVRGGIAVRESATGKLILINGGPGQGTTGNVPYFAVSKYTNSTTWSADYYFNASADWYQFMYASHIWYHITDDGTNLSFGYSYDGWNSRVIVTKPRADFMTGGPNQLAFFAGSSSNLSVRPLIVSLMAFRAA